MKDKFWKQNFEPAFKERFDESKDKWIDENLINEFKQSYEKLLASKNKYKKEHNEFLYALFIILLPISLLLIVPFYWVYKKFKSLHKTKKTLKTKVNEDTNAKLIIHKEIFDKINLVKIMHYFDGIINYENKGFIPYDLIEQIKQESLYTYDEINNNPFNSSWAILDKNKVVVNLAQQEHKEFLKTYTGSTSVSYYDSSTKRNEMTMVSASIEHPAFEINEKKQSYLLMLSCDSLDFSFDSKSNKISSYFHNRSGKYQALENRNFDNKFNWDRNNDAQFRMIFTPYAQEQYLENVSEGGMDGCYKWAKQNNFIFNQAKMSLNIGEEAQYFNAINFKFINDPNSTIETFYKEIYDAIINYYKQIYTNLNFYWLTTILQSEDHHTIIQHALKNYLKHPQDVYLLLHYALNEVNHRPLIINKSFNTFNTIKACEPITLNNIRGFKVLYKGLSYNIISRTIYVSTYSSIASKTVSVPINYDDYEPITNERPAYVLFNDSKQFYYHIGDKSFTNIDDEDTLNLAHEWYQKHNFSLKNGIIFLNDSGLDNAKITEIIRKFS